MSQQPYIGLRPFERTETDIFFGRETHTDELIDRLGASHFLAVVGTSGCGKSSLVKTGLIAGLEAGYLAKASTHWRIVEMRPSNQPFQALAAQLFSELNDILAAHYTVDSLRDTLKQGSLSLHELLAQHPLPNNAQLLIVCDQFEEIFRYFQQGAGAEARNFVSLLLASSKPYPVSTTQLSDSVYVVITMRSDFLGDCAQFAGLAEAINQGLYLTPRLNAQQLRAAIEEPAFVFDGEIEPTLITQLLEDAQTNQDQLPLLQHVLMRLWDLARDKTATLTLADYQASGGLSNALSNHADEVYNALTKRQKQIAEIIFRNLTERGDVQRDTRRPTKLAQLIELTDATFSDVVIVTGEFRRTGCYFLTPPNSVIVTPDSMIDIAHESLIRQWQRLKDWTADEADSAKNYQRLEDRAIDWQQQKAGLLQSPELEIYQQWWQEKNPNDLWVKRYGKDFALTKTFLTTSLTTHYQQQQKKNKHRRLVIVGLVCFSVVVSGLAGFIAIQYKEADMARLKAVEAQKDAEKQSALAKKEFQRAEEQTKLTNTANKKTENILVELAKFAPKRANEIRNQKNLEYINKNYEIEVKQNNMLSSQQYLKDILTNGTRKTVLQLLEPLISNTESMDDAEKKYWREKLPSMTDDQVKRLFDILYTEKIKLETLEIKYQNEIKNLNEKHLKEWVEFSIKKISKNNPATYLSAVNAILDEYKINGINIDDALKYLTEYQKLSVNRNDEVFYLYGKYYQLKGDKQKAKLNYIKAYERGLTGDNLVEIYDYSAKNKEFDLALKVAKRIVEEKKIQFEQDKKQLPTYKISFSWENKERIFSKELGKFLENIKLEGRYLENEFLKAVSNRYGKKLTNAEKVLLLKTFKFEFKPETLQESKVEYLKAVTKLLVIKTKIKDFNLPANFEEALQISEELRTKDLSEYLLFENILAFFYSDSGDNKKALQIQTDFLHFYENANQEDKNEIKKSWIAGKYSSLSWYQLLENQPKKAIVSAKKGLEYDKKQDWIKTNLTHGYLLSNQYCEAEKIHLAMRNEKIEGYDKQSWKELILEDFKVLKEKNITHPDMKKIITVLETGKPSTECTSQE